MKILLAPSETKTKGGEGSFDLDSLFLPQINEVREKIFNEYKNILEKNDFLVLSKLFGLKKEKDIQQSLQEFFSQKTKEAIKRYSGVAFDYLDYSSLLPKEQEYINKNVLIFSNLFGVIKADDLIPYYKLKQGEKVGSFEVDKIYQKALKEPLDSFLEDEDILDLRAKYYERFYKPSKKYTTLKFLKNQKVVSHYAKAYRGLVLRHLAKNNISSIKEFKSLKIDTLEIVEIIEKKSYNEIVYKIVK